MIGTALPNASNYFVNFLIIRIFFTGEWAGQADFL